MKILYITARPPIPIDTGEKVLVYNRLKILSRMHNISLIFLYEKDSDLLGIDELGKFCENIWPFKITKIRSIFNLAMAVLKKTPFQVEYYKSKKVEKQVEKIILDNSFDVVNAYLIRTLSYVEGLHQSIVLDAIDSMQLNLSRRVDNTKNIFLKKALEIELKRVRKYEESLHAIVSEILVVSSYDANMIQGDVRVIPLGVDLIQFAPSVSKEEGVIIFSGNMSYKPNIQAVKWFVDSCLTKIHEASKVKVKLLLAGSNPSGEVLSLASENIIVTGYVKSLASLISTSTVAIAPMQSGSGMQNKILEAMSCLTPVVSTSIGIGDIKVKNSKEVIVCDDPSDFADSVVRILNDPGSSKGLAVSARNFVKKNHSWGAHSSEVEQIYLGVSGG